MTVCAALDAIDRSLRAAVAERDKHRAAYSRSPSGLNKAALDTAQAELDAKLEERYRAQ